MLAALVVGCALTRSEPWQPRAADRFACAAPSAAITPEELRRIPVLRPGTSPVDSRVSFPRRAFGEADLTGRNLVYAQLQGADLRRAKLTNADFSGADLSGACLVGQRTTPKAMRGTILHRANLYGAALTGVPLVRAELDEAVLVGADLSGADLTGASLRGADLSGAKLGGATLAGTDLAGAVWDPETGPDPDRLGRLENAHLLRAATHDYDTAALARLRGTLLRIGNNRDALAVLTAMRRADTRRELGAALRHPIDAIGALLRLLALELPTDYGRVPERGVIALAVVWALFAFLVYLPWFLRHPVGLGLGLFHVLPKERIEDGPVPTLAAQDKLKRVVPGRGWQAAKLAAGVSLEAMLRVGLGRLQLVDIVARLRRTDSRYDATGPLRVVMGVQSLLGTFLLLSTLFAWLQIHLG